VPHRKTGNSWAVFNCGIIEHNVERLAAVRIVLFVFNVVIATRNRTSVASCLNGEFGSNPVT
jgi:hypothetical protein